VLAVVGYRAGDRASRSANGRAFFGVAIARVIADRCARRTANRRARQRPAGAKSKEGSNDSRSDNSFHIGHDIVSSISPGDNALKLGPFRFGTSLNQVRMEALDFRHNVGKYQPAAGIVQSVGSICNMQVGRVASLSRGTRDAGSNPAPGPQSPAMKLYRPYSANGLSLGAWAL
jgi:hypothetical protein